jgi:hypothetical protein
MRALFALAIVVAAGAPATSTAVTVESTPHRPTLAVVLRDPVTIRGSGFRPGERIRVTLPRQAVRIVRAGSGGGFVVHFGLGTHRCDLVRAVAVGGAGTRAALKLLPSPACLLDGVEAGAAASSAGASGRSAS